jgi:hypothetical protein
VDRGPRNSLLRLCSNIVSSLTDGVSGRPLVRNFRVVPNEDCRVGGLSRWSRGTMDTNLVSALNSAVDGLQTNGTPP